MGGRISHVRRFPGEREDATTPGGRLRLARASGLSLPPPRSHVLFRARLLPAASPCIRRVANLDQFQQWNGGRGEQTKQEGGVGWKRLRTRGRRPPSAASPERRGSPRASSVASVSPAPRGCGVVREPRGTQEWVWGVASQKHDLKWMGGRPGGLGGGQRVGPRGSWRPMQADKPPRPSPQRPCSCTLLVGMRIK
jgi:hypothetical protein